MSLKPFLLTILVSVIVSAATVVAVREFSSPSKDDLIASHYATENAVRVSPHSIRKMMDKGEANYVLVDLRSAQEYEREHIVGAVNIPAYKDPDTSAYDDVERIVSSFRTLIENNPGKDIIGYCYSIPCMTERKIGNMLVAHGIYIKELNIGWNEWRHFWTLWNHEHEWANVKVEDYIASGKEPGVPKIKKDSTVCPIEGDFGC
ncbi:MAG TPA: rhodanese-like domain-containing protein [Patescibacteria group bacterium]|nr:rhodanese-like domain-containing protein [Patescibacteria group bacterium]